MSLADEARNALLEIDRLIEERRLVSLRLTAAYAKVRRLRNLGVNIPKIISDEPKISTAQRSEFTPSKEKMLANLNACKESGNLKGAASWREDLKKHYGVDVD